tara:strand:+ start:638 stop:943 length:306 start_codon:yes stop_codon:yes gene_type:complete
VSFNWCHNPDCHTLETVSRVRGSGNNKVLRTVKIKETKWNEGHIFRYFCNQNCLFQFLNKFAKQITDTYSVKQPKETPIIIKKEKVNGWRGERIETRIIKG